MSDMLVAASYHPDTIRRYLKAWNGFRADAAKHSWYWVFPVPSKTIEFHIVNLYKNKKNPIAPSELLWRV